MDHFPFWLKLIVLAAIAVYRIHPVSRMELMRLARTASLASLKWKAIFMRTFFYVIGHGVFLAGLLAALSGSVLLRTGNVGAGILFWGWCNGCCDGAAISSAAQNRTCPTVSNVLTRK